MDKSDNKEKVICETWGVDEIGKYICLDKSVFTPVKQTDEELFGTNNISIGMINPLI